MNSREYVEQVLKLLIQRQQDEEIIALRSDLKTNETRSPEIVRLLNIAAATANFHRGRFDQAEDILARSALLNSLDGKFLRAKIEWKRGFPELAMALRDQLINGFPQNPEVYRIKTEWLLELELEDTARRVSLQRRLKFPQDPRVRIDLLHAFDRAKDETAVTNEVEALYQDFPKNYQVLLQRGDFAANTGRFQLAESLLAYARENGLPVEAATLMTVESLIVAGNYAAGLELAQNTVEQNPHWEATLAPVFNGLQAICYYALGDREEANLFLDNYLTLKTTRAENQIAVAERLVMVGASREARRVLQHAVEKDSLNQAALTRLIEFDLSSVDAPDLPANLERFLKMRRPPNSLLRDAYDRLGAISILLCR